MSKRTPHFAVATALLISCAPDVRADTDEVSQLRAWNTMPSCFDYVLMSSFLGSDSRPVLAFNHRSGRTQIVRMGETFDGHTITSCDTRTQRVFNASINAFQEKRLARAVLRNESGKSLALEQETPLRESGWMAYLVSIETGDGWWIKENDRIEIGDTEGRVLMVSERGIVISDASGSQVVVPTADDDERNHLVLAWEKRRNDMLEAERTARAKREEEEAQQARLQQVARTRQAPVREWDPATLPRRQPAFRFHYGTEYRIPIEYRAIPMVTSAGIVIYPYVLVPTRFETRYGGMSIDVR